MLECHSSREVVGEIFLPSRGDNREGRRGRKEARDRGRGRDKMV